MKIADIDLGERPLLLAPMEDVTDPSFRYMCKRFGADMVYTEFISSDGLVRDAAKSLKKLEIDPAERPVGIQIYGHLVEPMVEAALRAEAAGPDLIDINFGCPVKKIAGRGAGSGMMRDVPIIGNGDVDSGPRAAAMFDRYGVDGVMIGRATYGRPWIFREVKHYLLTGEVLPQPSVAERVAIAKEHLRKSLEIKGNHVGILEMRRHLTNYFKGLPDFKSTRMKLVTSLDPGELFATLDLIGERWGDCDLTAAVPPPLSHDI